MNIYVITEEREDDWDGVITKSHGYFTTYEAAQAYVDRKNDEMKALKAERLKTFEAEMEVWRERVAELAKINARPAGIGPKNPHYLYPPVILGIDTIGEG